MSSTNLLSSSLCFLCSASDRTLRNTNAILWMNCQYVCAKIVVRSGSAALAVHGDDILL